MDGSRGALARVGALAVLLALVAPAATGAPAPPGPAAAQTDLAWDQGTYGACVPATLQGGASARGAHRYCACIVAELDQLSLSQKQALTPSSPEFGQAAGACHPLAVAADEAAPGDAAAQRDAAWDRATYTACVPSAIGTGASSQGAARYCACIVAEFDELTPAQQAALTPASPDVAQAAAQCRPLAQAH